MIVCLTLAAIYLAQAKRMYQATTRLLILQQGGRPLQVSSNDTTQQVFAGTEDYLPTHMSILSSPRVVQPAIEAAVKEVKEVQDEKAKDEKAGSKDSASKDSASKDSASKKSKLKGVRLLSLEESEDPLETVTDNLKITRPDRMAKIVRMDYTASSRAEAVLMVEKITESYQEFLKESYKSTSDKIIELIATAKEEVQKDLMKLEESYLEFQRANPNLKVNAEGPSFEARRIDQWDQLMNQVSAAAAFAQVATRAGAAAHQTGGKRDDCHARPEPARHVDQWPRGRAAAAGHLGVGRRVAAEPARAERPGGDPVATEGDDAASGAPRAPAVGIVRLVQGKRADGPRRVLRRSRRQVPPGKDPRPARAVAVQRAARRALRPTTRRSSTRGGRWRRSRTTSRSSGRSRGR